MKQLKDYLHLYLGCRCVIINEDTEAITFILNSYNLNYYKTEIYSLKPILRPLSDMNGEEEIEYIKFQSKNSNLSSLQRSAEATIWFLSKHFDLFGLIDAGLAIDKTTLK